MIGSLQPISLFILLKLERIKDYVMMRTIETLWCNGHSAEVKRLKLRHSLVEIYGNEVMATSMLDKHLFVIDV